MKGAAPDIDQDTKTTFCTCFGAIANSNAQLHPDNVSAWLPTDDQSLGCAAIVLPEKESNDQPYDPSSSPSFLPRECLAECDSKYWNDYETSALKDCHDQCLTESLDK